MTLRDFLSRVCRISALPSQKKKEKKKRVAVAAHQSSVLTFRVPFSRRLRFFFSFLRIETIYVNVRIQCCSVPYEVSSKLGSSLREGKKSERYADAWTFHVKQSSVSFTDDSQAEVTPSKSTTIQVPQTRAVECVLGQFEFSEYQHGACCQIVYKKANKTGSNKLISMSNLYRKYKMYY